MVDLTLPSHACSPRMSSRRRCLSTRADVGVSARPAKRCVRDCRAWRNSISFFLRLGHLGVVAQEEQEAEVVGSTLSG